MDTDYTNIGETVAVGVGRNISRRSSDASISSSSASSAHRSPASTQSSALSSSVFPSMVTCNYNDGLDEFNDSGDYEDPDLFVSADTFPPPPPSQNMVALGRKTSGPEVRRSQSTASGSSQNSDTGISAENIQNRRLGLKKTITNNRRPDVIPHSINTSNDDDDEVPSFKPPKSNHSSRQGYSDVTSIPVTARDVGNGKESLQIKNIKKNLKPVLSRKDDREYQNSEDHQPAPINGTDCDNSSPAIKMPPVPIPNFSSSPSQRAFGNGQHPTQVGPTPIKASHAPKFKLGSRTSSEESDSGANSDSQSNRWKAGASTHTPPKLKNSPPGKAVAWRSASAALPPTIIDEYSDEDFEIFHPPGGGRVGKTLSEGRLVHNRRDKEPTDSGSTLEAQSWYFGSIDRSKSEELLRRMLKENGSYVVRKSQSGGPENPYALTVTYNRDIYHLAIRRRPDGKFAIGTPKDNEKKFNDVVELIKFHQNNSIELLGDHRKKGVVTGFVDLKKSPPKT